MIPESVYNEWLNSLAKLANKGPMSIMGPLLKTPNKKIQLTGGVKIKPSSRYGTVKLRRRTLIPSRAVYRRTIQHRVYRGTVQYLLILSSAIVIVYNAFNNPHYPSENSRDPLLEFYLYNILLPLVGAGGILPIIAEILLFFINFQIPIMVTQSLVNISNSWAQRGNSGLNAAQEISRDFDYLGNYIGELGTTTNPRPTDFRYTRNWPTMHPRPMPSGVPSAENMALAFRKGNTTINRMRDLFSPSAVFTGPFPTYDELVDSTRDYLLKRSLELNDANKRRVMLLAMSTMTRGVVLLLTKPGRRSVIVGHMFNRLKVKTVHKAITAPPALLPELSYYTKCDKCGATDQYNTVTFSRKCGNCSYDMCDKCYSKLPKRNPYSNTYNRCPRCKKEL